LHIFQQHHPSYHNNLDIYQSLENDHTVDYINHHLIHEMHIHLLEKNLDKVDWDWLSTNPNAIDLLKANQKKIKFNWLSMNPSIFILENNN